MKSQKITVIIFFLILALVPILIFCLPKEKFSQEENKFLTEFPSFSAENVWDRSFMNQFEKYVADHFPLRPMWIGMKTNVEHLSGKAEINGVFILKDRLIEKTDEMSEENIKKSIDAMNQFAKNYQGTTSLMLIPTASEIDKEMLPNAAPGISQKELIDGVYEKLESVFGIDAYSSLSSNAEKYIYYRLDHHWTSLGAYLAYSTSSKQLGFTPVPLEKFNIEHASHNFRGSLYSKVIYDQIEADNIDLYTYGNGSHATDVEIFDGNKWSKAEDIYFREYLRKKDQYAVFLGQNQPIITVHTDTKNGKNLLVFKDSYIHSMLPFLALHYEKITLVDLRYMKASFENWVDLDEYQQTLFCYNVKNFAVDADIQKINFPVSQK